jgi:hypothetical protein
VALLAIRDLLARTGRIDISRLDDHQVRPAARSLLHSAARLRNLDDIRILLEYFSESGGAGRAALQQLFDRAIDLLDFRVEKDKALLYAGQYATFRSPWQPPDHRLIAGIRTAAPLPSGAADKTTIAHTAGGRWLLPWNLRYLLGADGEDAVWTHATRRFIEEASGEVAVLLPVKEFDDVMGMPQWHPLYGVPGVTRVVYYVDSDTQRLQNPPRQLFDAGVVKKAFDMELVFRTQK